MPPIFQNVNSRYGYVRMRVNATTLITEVRPPLCAQSSQHVQRCEGMRPGPEKPLWTSKACTSIPTLWSGMQAVESPSGLVFDTVTIVSPSSESWPGYHNRLPPALLANAMSAVLTLS